MTLYELPPPPSALIEALRGIGYSLEDAVADIIDNSIAAGASNIHVRNHWNDDHPWLAIIDDGCGMEYDKLVSSMQLGCINPLAIRDVNDLGRFGMGLKTASLSQCRRLLVISKCKDKINGCVWDIDQISKAGSWQLEILEECDVANHKLVHDYLENSISGTIVLWETLDRMKEGEIFGEKEFNRKICEVYRQIGLCFHRFLSPMQGIDIQKKKIIITGNGTPIDADCPFHKDSQELEREFLCNRKIVVRPYILPRYSKIPQAEFSKYGGEEGYLNNQGFYVYRNRRLIVKGDWFRLVKKKELTKLCRVMIDILTNEQDHSWKIDIKKSHVFPPENIRRELVKIIDKILITGKCTLNPNKRKSRKPKPQATFWVRKPCSERISYEINRDHPLFQQINNEIDDQNRNRLNQFFSLLEKFFPQDQYYHDFADKPELLHTEEDSGKEARKTLQSAMENILGFMPDIQLEGLMTIEPFNRSSELTEQLWKEMETADGLRVNGQGGRCNCEPD
jgi:hypothetical protein